MVQSVIADKFESVTEHSILNGRCFAFQAHALHEKGKIASDDPRFLFRKSASIKDVPSHPDDYRKIWDSLLEASHPRIVRASLMAGDRSLTSTDQNQGLGKNLAICLESAAVHIAGSGHEHLRNLASLYVQKAAIYCDAEVLQRRHQSETRHASVVSQASGIPPQRILSGMIRKGYIDNQDFRIRSLTEGHTTRYNKLSREDFFKNSSREIKDAFLNIELTDSTVQERSEIVIALARLQSSNKSKTVNSVKESDVLESSAILSESLAMAWSRTDPDRAKRLAGISMSASARSLLVRGQNTKDFLGTRPNTNIQEL